VAARPAEPRRTTPRAQRALTIISTAVVTAILTSAFWIFTFNILGGPEALQPAGKVEKVQPPGEPPVAIAQGLVVGPAGLAIPVPGVKQEQLVDTFDQARANGRVHDAIDIMAPEGTPVLAAADGTIEKLFFSKGGGGITVYERSADRKWMYYYAHLQAYAPGLREGQQVKQGQVIARVDHTGDANASAPHLHFAINQMQPGQRWWQGTPINPYPLLAGKKVGG
jgi:murein DD-endopeptidase MepM/ murein hydrolase activator NlpD